jgi:hypothetical protein
MIKIKEITYTGKCNWLDEEFTFEFISYATEITQNSSRVRIAFTCKGDTFVYEYSASRSCGLATLTRNNVCVYDAYGKDWTIENKAIIDICPVFKKYLQKNFSLLT